MNISVTKIASNKTIEINQSLDIMHQASSDMVNKLNDIVWFIQPEHDTLEKLLERLTDYTNKMAAIKNIRVLINFPDELSKIVLPVAVRRNIYLLFKEAINNVVKHSGAANLEVQLIDSNNQLDFIISDDGHGYIETNVKKGNGLENMRKRAKDIGAQLNIISMDQKGTRISLKYN